MANRPRISPCAGLSKQFQGDVIYDSFNLDIPRGSFTSIFGPNGCGKSTLINLISGLIPVDRGTILFGGKTLAQTRIGYVFQNYREALFPWMTAFDNIHYALQLRKVRGAGSHGSSRTSWSHGSA